MTHHGIQSAARLTALSPFTIRAWELRHGVVQPRRDSRGRRSYSKRELQRLMLLAKATRQGHRVGEIARLSDARLGRLVMADDDALLARAERSRRAIVDAVRDYEVDALCRACGQALAQLPPLEAIERVLTPALHEIGERWLAGTISVAQEHLLSGCVQRVLFAQLHGTPAAAGGEPFLCGTLSGESHSLGSLMAAYLASALGYPVYFVGENLPAEEFRLVLNQSKAAGAAISVATDEHAAQLPAQLQVLCRGLRPGLPVYVGGRSAQRLRDARLPAQCRVLDSMGGLLDVLLEA